MEHILNLWKGNAEFPAPQRTFDTFIVGDSNREAFLAAKSVSGGLDRPGALLILCGSSGVGKTHLLHAIHAEILAHDSSAIIKRMNADDFTACLIHSIHTGTTDQFRAECQSADAFLLDDVQFLAGKQRTQEEFLLILEARCHSGCCTVITLDCTSEEAKSIGDTLRSRFPNAVVATLAEPGYEVRADIVRAKAMDLELRLSEEEIDLIAQHVPGSLRNIQGVLNRINFYHSFPEAFPDAPSISEIIHDISFN